MAAIGKDLPYSSLPTGVDAIRILKVEPGDFFDPLVCTLSTVAFSNKPKYIALSYTWEVPYSDMARLPTSPNENKPPSQSPNTIEEQLAGWSLVSSKHEKMEAEWGQASLLPVNHSKSSLETSDRQLHLTVNECPFLVGHNLYLALLHLRSRILPLALWVDAICINQKDTAERNAQVALMSFIYMRAMKVVAWLGTKEYRNKLDLFHYMSIEWKAGQSQYFAASTAQATKLRCSLEPDQSTFGRITESSYWTRMWIVQELCIPRLLVFAYGSCIWTYEDFRRWHILDIATAGRVPSSGIIPQGVENQGLEAMLQLFDTRDSKYTDAMRLESLIERFAGSKCRELRDKVYGLVGLANDIRPFSKADGSVKPIEGYIDSLDFQSEDLPEPERGIGSFQVDYSHSLFEIWTDVVKFVYFRARSIEGRINDPALLNGIPEQAETTAVLLRSERQISVIRTANIVQDALSPMIESKIGSLNSYQPEHERPVIRAIGYLSSEIVKLGPDCEALASSFRAHQDWVGRISAFYNTAADAAAIRRVEEAYAVKIISYGNSDLAKVASIRNPHVVAWRVPKADRPETSSSSYTAMYEKIWDTGDDEELQLSEGPRVCLGTNLVLGLVPSAAKVGDVIVQFWNCNAAMVMRPIDLRQQLYVLVGRADVSEAQDRQDIHGYDIRTEQSLFGNSTTGLSADSPSAGPLYIDLDFRTLQCITASFSRTGEAGNNG